MNIKKILKSIGKNLLVFVFGGLAGIVISAIYVTKVWFPAVAEKLGLAVIILLPVMILLFGTIGIILGGVVGMIIYNLIKYFKK